MQMQRLLRAPPRCGSPRNTLSSLSSSTGGSLLPACHASAFSWSSCCAVDQCLGLLLWPSSCQCLRCNASVSCGQAVYQQSWLSVCLLLRADCVSPDSCIFNITMQHPLSRSKAVIGQESQDPRTLAHTVPREHKWYAKLRNESGTLCKHAAMHSVVQEV